MSSNHSSTEITHASVTESNMASFSNSTRTIFTQEERMQYLEYLDDKKWPYIYPVIIYLLLLMVIGVVGNIIVLVIYKNRFKPSTNRLFILTLATFDLLTCSLSIPGVIVELRYHYTFFFPALCRIFRASRMYFVLVSTFTLVVVAVDRYRKVCHPLKPQYTIKSAGHSILTVNIIAVIFTILGAVVGGKRTVQTDRDDITGSNCSYDDEFIGKSITKFYSVVWFFQFILCVTLFIVLYSLIGRTIWKHRRFQFDETTEMSASSTSSVNTISSGELHNHYFSLPRKYKLSETEASSAYSIGTENVKVISFSEIRISNASSVQMTVPEVYDKHKSGNTKQSKRAKFHSALSTTQRSARGTPPLSTNKTAFTMFIITMVFIVSFLPFLILVALWGSSWNFVNGLHGYVFTVYKIFFHSYHVNNVVNCYIYSFFNPKFRHECKQVFRSRGQGSRTVERTSTFGRSRSQSVK